MQNEIWHYMKKVLISKNYWIIDITNSVFPSNLYELLNMYLKDNSSVYVNFFGVKFSFLVPLVIFEKIKR